MTARARKSDARAQKGQELFIEWTDNEGQGSRKNQSPVSVISSHVGRA